jgi:isopenicillin-N epimerase
MSVSTTAALQGLREQFLLDPAVVHLNHGSFGACSRVAFDAYQSWQLALERNPMRFLARESGALMRSARTALAEFVGARAEDLAFVTNVTHGVNAVARSIELQPGDEVLSTDLEYGACDAAWQAVCRQRGASYRRVAIAMPFDTEQFLQAMARAIGPRTRVVFASHITSSTSLTLPVASLCKLARDTGVLAAIDGAHAPGQLALDLDALGADFYMGALHKWLCAPKGSAFVHARSALHGGLRGPIVSWGDHEEADRSELIQSITGSEILERSFQWQGTRDLAAFLAVPRAIEFQREHAWPSRQARCHELAVALQRRILARNGLAPLASDESFVQMVSIPVRASSSTQLMQWLASAHAIETLGTAHGEQQLLRVSVQGYNDEADLHRLEGALDEAGV